jgi:hypothetical protein
MEKHRHPPVTTLSPYTTYSIVKYSPLTQVKHTNPMEAIQTPISSQFPTNLPSTSNDRDEEDIQVP